MGRNLRQWIAACALLAVAACGGGSAGSGSAAPGAPAVPAGSTAHISITIPSAANAGSGVRRQYVSANTQSVRIHVASVNGGAPTPAISDLVANVTATSNGCSSGAAGVTCSLAMTLPGGSLVVLQITTYDATGGAGNVLSRGTTASIDTSVANPSVSISLGGTVSSVVISPAIVSAAADGTTHTLTMLVSAKDASGATIVAPGNYAAPIALSIGNDVNGALSLSATSIAAPTATGATTIHVTYDSTKALTNGQIFANGSAIAAVNPLIYTPSTLSPMTVGGSTQTVTVSEFGNSSAFVIGSTGGHLTSTCAPASCAPSTPGGSVTFTFTAATGGTGTVAIADSRGTAASWPFTITGGSGGPITVPVYSIFEYSVPTGGGQPGGIAASPDGKNLFFTEGSNQNIAEVFPSTCVDGTPPSGTCTIGEESLGGGYAPVQITSASDGNVYALSTANSQVEQIQYSSCGTAATLTCTHAPLPGVSPGPEAMTSDRNGLLYVSLANGGTPNISAFSLASYPCCAKPFGDVYVAPATATPVGIAAAYDGNIYATFNGDSNLYQLICAGSCNVASFTVDGSALGAMIAVPGGLWIADPAAGNTTLVKVDPASCFGSSCTVSGTSATIATSVGSLALGPDGNIWFTEPLTGRIGMMRTSGCSMGCPIKEFSVPSGASATPSGVAAGPDGNVWFTEAGSNKLGKVVL